MSGDPIQGVDLEALDYGRIHAAQYVEAADFLGKLAVRFLGVDRSRLVIVPGNHDIDWNTAGGIFQERYRKFVHANFLSTDSSFRASGVTLSL